MTISFTVPEDILPSFEKTMAYAPEALCNDQELKQAIVMFLKIGGQKMALQHLELLSMPFPTEFDLFKKKTEINDESDIEEGETEETDDQVDDEE